MNIKKVLAVLTVLIMSAGALRADDKNGWQVELRKAALNLTTTEVKNSEYYQGYPNTRLTADSQTVIQGTLNAAADYHAPKYLWANTLLMEYGKTTVRPINKENTETENQDRALLTSDIAHRTWQEDSFLGGFYAGPFAALEYQTEFTHSPDAYRRKTLRGRAGLKLFEGKYIKNLYTSFVLEEDLTYPHSSLNTAWESGFRIEQDIREGVKATYTALYRDYLNYGVDQWTDLDYELELSARMDVLVYKNLAVAPFITYYSAKGINAPSHGENLYVGVSFSFSHVFIAADTVN